MKGSNLSQFTEVLDCSHVPKVNFDFQRNQLMVVIHVPSIDDTSD
jgi:hypothetical protein